MPPPTVEPIGLRLSRTSRILSRALDDTLVAAGASLSQWSVLVSVQAAAHGTQRGLAAAMGIEGPTLTHHLNRMEAAGLVVRTRDVANRRIQRVELTPAGVELFSRLRATVAAFDRQLRAGIDDDEVAQLRQLLARMQGNVERPADVHEGARP